MINGKFLDPPFLRLMYNSSEDFSFLITSRHVHCKRERKLSCQVCLVQLESTSDVGKVMISTCFLWDFNISANFNLWNQVTVEHWMFSPCVWVCKDMDVIIIFLIALMTIIKENFRFRISHCLLPSSQNENILTTISFSPLG